MARRKLAAHWSADSLSALIRNFKTRGQAVRAPMRIPVEPVPSGVLELAPDERREAAEVGMGHRAGTRTPAAICAVARGGILDRVPGGARSDSLLHRPGGCGSGG